MTTSSQLFADASHYLPGGVNSPVRAFRGVGGDPIFMCQGQGAYVTDVEGKRYIDYIGAWGPMILGHAHPEVVKKAKAALDQGFGFGTPTEIETALAKKVCALMPSIEMVRFVNSGTEATMTAIRLARGFTKRNKILKFAGCYHGHADSLLVAAGSGALTLGVPDSLGVPESLAQHTLTAAYNDLSQVEALFARYGDDIACIIVEPVAGNMNCILPMPGFLSGLRQICDQYASVLIFDEVMTGFRVALGGAQAHFHVTPDLTTLGKVVGGGFPVGAFGGKKEIMQQIAPLGGVYQAGTLSGNPIAMTAGLATLDVISKHPDFYEQLSQKTHTLMKEFEDLANVKGVALKTHAVGGMFGYFFTDLEIIQNEQDVKCTDLHQFKRFYHEMLKAGVYLAPSAFEAGFMSAAHSDLEIANTLSAVEKAFISL